MGDVEQHNLDQRVAHRVAATTSGGALATGPGSKVGGSSRAMSVVIARVLKDERHRAALLLARIRVVVASVAFVASLPILFFEETREPGKPTLYGALMYFVFAIGISQLVRRRPSFVEASTVLLPLFDVPLIQSLQLAQIPLLPQPFEQAASSVGLMGGLVILSSLTLSRPIIFATAAFATAAMMMTLALLRFSPVTILYSAVSPVGAAMVASFIVRRIADLVHDARKGDLLGKYVLGRRIGAGGMAEVFEAMYSPEGGFERRVAVKRLLPALSEQAELVEMFRREAKLGALLAHPNVVQVLDFGSDGSTYFLAMEYVQGATLSEVSAHLRKHGATLSPAAIVYLLGEIAEALDYIHTRRSPQGEPLKLVHRDLNPPNILVSSAGDVKLADFGIARASIEAHATKTGTFRGKIAYAAPEQLTSQNYDSRADLFALGTTIFELCSGRRLFGASGEYALVNEVLGRQLDADLEQVPAILRPVTAGLLERSVEARTQSAADLRTALSALPFEWRDPEKGRAELVELVALAVAGRVTHATNVGSTTSTAKVEIVRKPPAAT